ncbi:MAG: hypothetical protein KJ587_07280 [Alphaproteobacteria bacterium]|nr:hypothetical protein [Alphaproteobacteria bacterium]
MPDIKEFSARQAARLKTRLIAYRALASRSGAPLPLIRLIHEIGDSEAAHIWLRIPGEEHDDSIWDENASPVRTERADKGAPMTTNVLQKWFSGELVTRGRGAARMRVRHFTTPSPNNLMAIYAFLQEKWFITDPELAEDPWPHAVIATTFCSYLKAQNGNAGTDGAAGALGEFYTANATGRDIIIRRISITERGLGAAVAAEERVMIFARSALTATSSATTIDLHRPRAVAVLDGWGFASGTQLSLFTHGQPETHPVWHTYNAINRRQEEDGSASLELATLTMRAGEAASLSQGVVTNNPAAFIDQTLALLKSQGTRIQGPRIKLLRPSHLPTIEPEVFALLAGCFSYDTPTRMDWERFALLAGIVQNINARAPDTGSTILHLMAQTLNRPAIKTLLKRKDLDVLARDNDGYFPSQRALETDSRSAVGHYLLKKEIAAAQSRGFDYAKAIAAIPLTPVQF